MQLTVTLGGNSFQADAAEIEALKDLFRLWLNAQQPNSDALKIEELTNKLRTNNDSLSVVVAQFSKEGEA